MWELQIFPLQNDVIEPDDFTFDAFYDLYHKICPRNDIEELFQSMWVRESFSHSSMVSEWKYLLQNSGESRHHKLGAADCFPKRETERPYIERNPVSAVRRKKSYGDNQGLREERRGENPEYVNVTSNEYIWLMILWTDCEFQGPWPRMVSYDISCRTRTRPCFSTDSTSTWTWISPCPTTT